MKNLLKKELHLTASILSYLFIAFGTMAMIPQYPILIGAFFGCFGIFHTFQKSREANDILFTTLLPVKKTDIVKVKYLFTVLIQMAEFVLMAALTVVRMLFLNNIEPYASNALMSANLAYLGYVLMVFAAFNILFVGGFFKTAYKIGIPFLMFSIATLVILLVGEVLHFLPGLEMLNSNFHWSHLVVLGVGAAAYSLGTFLSFKISKHNFETIDL